MDIPDGSIYMAMYRWGLSGIEPDVVESELLSAGKDIREKDWQNYWNGRKKHVFRTEQQKFWKQPMLPVSTLEDKLKPYENYDRITNEWLLFERTDRYVPCLNPLSHVLNGQSNVWNMQMQ